MPKPRQTLGVPPTPEAVAAAVGEMQRLFGQGFTLGDPHPANAMSLARTTFGAVRRPPQVIGAPDNLNGAWSQVTIDTAADIGLGVNLRIYHGLRLNVPSARPGANQVLNCRWTVMGLRYNGTPAAPFPDASVAFGYVDGAVDADWIELQLWTNLTGANIEPEALVVTLFFWPASR